MKRRQIFAGNWKMHKDRKGALELVQGLIEGLEQKEGREYLIFPPSVYLCELSEKCSESILKTGIQNVYFEPKGAFTGENSVDMAKDCGSEFILIGHSERRHVFGETDDDINKKLRAVLDSGVTPVLCVGELLEDRESQNTTEVLKTQIESAFGGVSDSEAKNVILAYEPVWAIGTGKVATPEIAEDTHKIIRKIMANIYGSEIAEAVSILYGGSVKPDNIAGLYSLKDIDGVLVGGASLEVESFISICSVD